MTIPSKHIVFLTPGFAKDELETQCLPYFQNYLLAFQAANPHLKLSVISLNYPYRNTSYYWNGIIVFPLNRSIKGIATKPLLWTSLFRSIQNLHQDYPITVLHSLWLQDTALVGHYAARFLGVKHLCTAMGQDVIWEQNRLLRFLPLHKMEVVMVSEFQEGVLRKSKDYHAKAIIPWGLGEQKIEVPQVRSIDLLNVGDINAVKNTAFFVEIVAILKSSFPNIRCVIIGRDLRNGQIQDRIKTLKLEDNIQLTGELANERVHHYMAQSKILVHTSDYESQAYVFLEALQAGMQILSRPVGIAAQNSYWRLANDLDSFVEQARQALQEEYQPESIIKYPISDTASSYSKLYDL